MCDLIFMDVTLRAAVISVFFAIFLYFLNEKRNELIYFTRGITVSLIASIVFFFEGFELFKGATELQRLPLCLLVIGIWGVSFYLYYCHFASYTENRYLGKYRTVVFILLLLNITVSMSGLFLIIPPTISLYSTGLTTTLQGSITFGLTFIIIRKVYKQTKAKSMRIDYAGTLLLFLGNLTFLFLSNYSIALEIIIVCIIFMSLNYILNPNYPNRAEISKLFINESFNRPNEVSS